VPSNSLHTFVAVTLRPTATDAGAVVISDVAPPSWRHNAGWNPSEIRTAPGRASVKLEFEGPGLAAGTSRKCSGLRKRATPFLYPARSWVQDTLRRRSLPVAARATQDQSGRLHGLLQQKAAPLPKWLPAKCPMVKNYSSGPSPSSLANCRLAFRMRVVPGSV
jgi:hypothetical protein